MRLDLEARSGCDERQPGDGQQKHEEDGEPPEQLQYGAHSMCSIMGSAQST